MGSSDMFDITWWDWIKTEEVLLKELKQGFSVRKANTFIDKLCSQKPEYCGSAREALMKACKEIPMSDDDCKQIVDPVMKNFCEKNSNKDSELRTLGDCYNKINSLVHGFCFLHEEFCGWITTTRPAEITTTTKAAPTTTSNNSMAIIIGCVIGGVVLLVVAGRNLYALPQKDEQEGRGQLEYQEKLGSVGLLQPLVLLTRRHREPVAL
ncbi:hypothetical protein L3Y34_016330 [Caenorhabditis briggsae]|uniref:Uncharacterized protein n=1 Tax=Caenorhabditis briggsae TaxID=6238 RepID=A0AAE9DXD6_CAEBR|nr:hypothetical protein L3Y34_016330 [Caenorhabditis briggsae]